MYHFVPIPGSDLQCPHEWTLREGNDNIPCFNCGYNSSVIKRGKCKHGKKQICNICLKELFDLIIPETHTVKTSTRNVLLETKVSVLEKRRNLLETEVTNLNNKNQGLSHQAGSAI